MPAGAIGLDRAREGQLGPEALNADFEAPADTRTFFERNPNVVNGLLVLAALVAAVGGFLASAAAREQPYVAARFDLRKSLPPPSESGGCDDSCLSGFFGFRSVGKIRITA